MAVKRNRRYLLTAGKGILKDLLESEELQNGKIDRGMETKSSFIWSQSRVELHSVAPVDLYFSLVVLPDDTELYNAFRDRSNLQSLLIFRIFLEERGVLES